jgi:5-methyltetrahydropteroyltriglutamate--homocysteine methyltransferase
MTDIPLEDITDLLLQVRAGAYYVEAANPRHEHECRVWQADRLVRYAEVVGRENIIAGTDCGVGGRIDAEVAWAKLRVMVEGAELASRQLWRAAVQV